jgi:hypothetical protein
VANNYKNAAVVLTSTGATDLYTCPSGRTAIVQSVNVANVDSSNRDVTVTLYDSSVATSYTVIYNATVPVGVSMNALSTPLVLEPGDIVRVQASAANTLHATASVLEQDATAIQVDGSITTAKIADDAVTADKLASSLSATTICTSSTRPASPFEGQKIYETDTGLSLIYDGSAWVSPSVTHKPPSAQITHPGNFTTNEGVGITVTGISTVSWDTDSMTTTADRLTINTPGLYSAHARILTPSGTSTDYRMGIRITQYNSGGSQVQDLSHAGSYINIGWGKDRTVAGVFKCSTGDYFTMRIDVDSSTNNTGMAFGAALLQATFIGAA